jgi:hypothetical protein
VYGAIQFTYKEQAKTGAIGKEHPVEWSQVLNTDKFAVDA